MGTLSLVIPCFNEERNLEKLFSSLESELLARGENLEIVFVNDGSTDTTGTLLRSFQERHHSRVRLIDHPYNRGKGYAVRVGMQGATGKWRLMMDADLAVPFSEIDEVLILMERGAAVVIGSRVAQGSKLLVSQGVFRQIFGKMFTVVANIVTELHVSDFTCGFKCFSAEVAEKIFPPARINRWAYDVEILYLSKKNNFSITEIGVPWSNGPDTKVRVVRDAIRALVDLIRIRGIHG